MQLATITRSEIDNVVTLHTIDNDVVYIVDITTYSENDQDRSYWMNGRSCFPRKQHVKMLKENGYEPFTDLVLE